MSVLKDLHYIYDQCFPVKPSYSTHDVPDLSGKVVVVTGGGSGIGFETSKVLLVRNAKVYIATRNANKAMAAIEQLEAQTGKKAFFLKLDLTSLSSVKAAAAEFTSLERQLHILFNNAGIGGVEPLRCPTLDGYETAMATNVIGHFHFTRLLLPTLRTTAASSGSPVRIINTSSVTHYICRNMDFDSFKEGPARRARWHLLLYAQSKLANIIFSNELHKRFQKDGIVSIAVNPGKRLQLRPYKLPEYSHYDNHREPHNTSNSLRNTSGKAHHGTSGSILALFLTAVCSGREPLLKLPR
jgi:retinol dehydrogenase-12